MDRKYDNMLRTPSFAKLYNTTPFYNIWDDHDFWSNNSHAESVDANLTYALAWTRQPFAPLRARYAR